MAGALTLALKTSYMLQITNYSLLRQEIPNKIHAPMEQQALDN